MDDGSQPLENHAEERFALMMALRFNPSQAAAALFQSENYDRITLGREGKKLAGRRDIAVRIKFFEDHPEVRSRERTKLERRQKEQKHGVPDTLEETLLLLISECRELADRLDAMEADPKLIRKALHVHRDCTNEFDNRVDILREADEYRKEREELKKRREAQTLRKFINV